MTTLDPNRVSALKIESFIFVAICIVGVVWLVSSVVVPIFASVQAVANALH